MPVSSSALLNRKYNDMHPVPPPRIITTIVGTEETEDTMIASENYPGQPSAPLAQSSGRSDYNLLGGCFSPMTPTSGYPPAAPMNPHRAATVIMTHKQKKKLKIVIAVEGENPSKAELKKMIKRASLKTSDIKDFIHSQNNGTTPSHCNTPAWLQEIAPTGQRTAPPIRPSVAGNGYNVYSPGEFETVPYSGYPVIL